MIFNGTFAQTHQTVQYVVTTYFHGVCNHVISSPQVDVVHFLLEAGMDIEATEEAGATALYLAAENGQLPVVQCFWVRFSFITPGIAICRGYNLQPPFITGAHLVVSKILLFSHLKIGVN